MVEGAGRQRITLLRFCASVSGSANPQTETRRHSGNGGACGMRTETCETRQTSVARFRRRRLGSRLRLKWALSPLGHELIELGAVFGEAQPREEILELALLVLEALQRLRAIIVEGAIAARG